MPAGSLPAARKALAKVHLKPEDIVRIQTEPKGEVLVSVTVTDESGNEPIKCEMLWAWVPKQR